MSPTPSAAAFTAGNFTVTPTGASPDAVFSDKVALAALVLGGGAFVIAFLQMFYQYLTTSLRDKCSSGAIGEWQHFARTGWDFANWRPRIEYPLVALDPWWVLRERGRAESSLIKELTKITELKKSGRYEWTQSDSPDDFGLLQVWHGTKVLRDCHNDKVVKLFQLRWEAQYQWLKYLRKYPRRKLMIARASWANMLFCLGVTPWKEPDLKIKLQRADIIPAGMDNPLQSTSLGSIKTWCFLLGMKDVKIDDAKATITARNKYAALGTINQNIPGVTNVISLEGDLDGLQTSIFQASTSELFRIMARARGLIDFVAFQVSAVIYQPLNIVDNLQRGRFMNWDPTTTLPDVGNLIWEANQIHNLPFTIESGVSFWQSLGVGACPSILQTLAFLPYQTICGCFPLRTCLSPYADYVSTMSIDWWSREGKNLCEVDPQLYRDAVNGGIPFLRAESSFLLVLGEIPGHCGSRSWIFHSCHKKLKGWDPNWFDRITKLCEVRNGEFLSKFPILSIVDRQLGGNNIDGSPETLQIGRQTVTLEAALWLTLFTLEGRIEALWDEILADGQSVTVDSKESSYDYVRCLDIDLNSILWPSHPDKFSSLLASFLALWLSLCQKVDLFSGRPILSGCFDQILKDWEGREDMCIPTPDIDNIVSHVRG